MALATGICFNHVVKEEILIAYRIIYENL